MKRIALQLFALLPFVGYSVYSYTQADSNLVLSTFPLYWKAQEWLWQIGYHQRELSAWMYGGLLVAMVVSCMLVVKKFSESEKKSTLISVALILLLSHNALSHDIFNYIFNARMVVKYAMNPHIHTALEFPSDDWTRFMHNTHTPAPYGYGWTLLSLTPIVLGSGKFLVTYVLMKVWIIVGFVLLWFAMKRLALMANLQKVYENTKWFLFLNPLVLIETFSNAHNDAWMMAPAVFALSLMFSKKKRSWIAYGYAAVSMIFSISIKFASIVLLPIFLILALRSIKKHLFFNFVDSYWAELSSIALFLPLLTSRSQQFHPWYLIWSLTFIPFIKMDWMRWLFVAFSVSSLVRYVPYIRVGDYTQGVLSQELLLTWIGGLGLFGVGLCVKRLHSRMLE